MQHAVGSEVKTLTMPPSGRAFIGLMAMGMMFILVPVVLHLIVGTLIATGSDSALANAEEWSIWLEASRRFGVSTYLLSIALGLATIITVLRFQSVRLGQIVSR